MEVYSYRVLIVELCAIQQPIYPHLHQFQPWQEFWFVFSFFECMIMQSKAPRVLCSFQSRDNHWLTLRKPCLTLVILMCPIHYYMHAKTPRTAAHSMYWCIASICRSYIDYGIGLLVSTSPKLTGEVNHLKYWVNRCFALIQWFYDNSSAIHNRTDW